MYLLQNKKASLSIDLPSDAFSFILDGPGGIRTPDTVVRSHVL